MEERKIHPLRFIPAEGYLVADLGIVDSMVGEGWLGGNTLGELMQTYMEKIVGDPCFEYYGTQFPVTVRILHADDGIAPTVSPDDVTAESRYDSLGRTTFLYVVDAAPGAMLRLGFRETVASAGVYLAAEEGRLSELLDSEPLSKGDSVVVRPGTVYAVEGKAVLVEVAEASALQFSLHGEDLMEAFDFIDYGKTGTGVLHTSNGGGPARELCSTPHFKVSELVLDNPLRISPGDRDGFSLYVPVRGGAVVQWKDFEGVAGQTRLRCGECVLVPSDTGEFLLAGTSPESMLLEILPGEIPPVRDEYESQQDNHSERNITWTR
ncbi:MAG: hypothetical protein IJM35_05215 [Bacteroidales bacterium]|nr:hypothetical protein [Bacteroidales bacterium]